MPSGRMLLVFLNASIALSVQTATADSCRLSGKTIIAYVDNCGDVFGGYQCETKCSKLVFLGDKILFYEGLAAKKGDVYYLGKSVDMTDDWRRDPKMSPVFSDPNVSVVVTGTASGTFENFSLRYEAQLVDRRRGFHRSRSGYVLTFRVRDCQSCEVTASIIFKEGRTGSGRSTMKKQTCTVLDRVD